MPPTPITSSLCNRALLRRNRLKAKRFSPSTRHSLQSLVTPAPSAGKSRSTKEKSHLTRHSLQSAPQPHALPLHGAFHCARAARSGSARWTRDESLDTHANTPDGVPANGVAPRLDSLGSPDPRAAWWLANVDDVRAGNPLPRSSAVSAPVDEVRTLGHIRHIAASRASLTLQTPFSVRRV